VKHARYYWLFLAERHLTRRRFGAMLGRIALLPEPTGWRMVVKLYRIGDRWVRSRSTSFHNVANRRNGRTIIAVFEVKKRIPAN
jgi:hypothetical protein